MIVVDTTVVAYAVIPGERTEAALAVARRDSQWVAPRLSRSELRNLLATAMRVEGMDLVSALAAFAVAEELVEDMDIEGATARPHRAGGSSIRATTSCSTARERIRSR